MATTYSPCPECRKLNRVDLEQARQKAPVCGGCKTALPLHGMLNELTSSQLANLSAKSPLPVIADFWAPWCGPCRSFAPIFERVALRRAGQAVFAKVDVQSDPTQAMSYAIRGVPVLILFRGGIEVDRVSGAMPERDFEAWLEKGLRVAAAA